MMRLIFLLMMLIWVLAAIGGAAIAQEAQLPTPSAVEPLPQPLYQENAGTSPEEQGGEPIPGVPDLSPTIDELSAGLNDFFTSAAVLMGVLAYLVTLVAKWVIPARVLETRTIYGVIVTVFTVAYFGAQLLGAGESLGQGVEVGTALARTLLVILGMFAAPSLLYAAGRKLDNPIAGGQQGAEWFSFKPRDQGKAA